MTNEVQHINRKKVTVPIRLSMDFGSIEQVQLFERFIKRITKSDLQALMFKHAEANSLLTVLGEVRAPLKSISRTQRAR